MKRNRQALDAALAQVDREHLRRKRRTVEAFADADSPTAVIVDGQKLVNFCSNDYLGLSRHPQVAAAMSEAALRFGSGSGASHLVSGHGREHDALEEELAAFTGCERALLFSTGYMANLAAIGTFADRGDLVLLDRLSHASLIDAGLLSGARFKRYAHNDVEAASRALGSRHGVLDTRPNLPRADERNSRVARRAASGQTTDARRNTLAATARTVSRNDARTDEHSSSGAQEQSKDQRYTFDDEHTASGEQEPREHRRVESADEHGIVIATDGVFSMDGDIAPLRELADLAESREAWLVVDDAHGLGVLGASGRGTIEHTGLNSDRISLLVGTLGKAFGTFGAFVAGARDVIEILIQRARTYIYTTALPQPVAAATRTSLAVAQRESWRRERVMALTQRFRAAAEQVSIPLMPSITPIQPVLLGDSEAALAASHQLFAAGFWVTAIRPPTVPRGEARLRVTLSAAHTETQVDALVDALSRAIRESTCTRST